MFMLDKYMLAANVETCLIMLCFFASLKTYYWDMGWIQMWDQIWPTKLRTNFRIPSGWSHVWPDPWDPTGSGGGSILGYQNTPRKVRTKSCIPGVCFTFMKSTCWIALQKKTAVLWHNVACTTSWEACFAAQARLSNERLSTTAATIANHRPDEVTWALNHHFMNAWMDASADVCIDVYVHKYMCLYRCTSQT